LFLFTLAREVKVLLYLVMQETPQSSDSVTEDHSDAGDTISMLGVEEMYAERKIREDREAKRRALRDRVRDLEMRLRYAPPGELKLCRQELESAQADLNLFDRGPSVAPEVEPEMDMGR
jgi:KaiC/GvpD/RAD55 family RecA-like ATPase